MFFALDYLFLDPAHKYRNRLEQNILLYIGKCKVLQNKIILFQLLFLLLFLISFAEGFDFIKVRWVFCSFCHPEIFIAGMNVVKVA